ncbi:hypothetical protein D3C76_886300 [compost metagenome]
MANLIRFQQLFARHLVRGEQYMSLAAIQPLPLFEQRLVIERRLVTGKVADGKIQALFQQQPFKLCRRCADQFQLHGFLALAKT